MSVSPVSSTGIAALTDAGIGSGLNVNAIVSQLMIVQSLPLTQLNNQITSYQTTLSAYGAVTSALSTFQSAVQSIDSASAFGALSVTPSNTSVLSGTADSTASAGNYSVVVSQLAQAQTLTSTGQSSSSTAIGTGTSTTISFEFGTVSANLTGSTLASSVASSGIAAGSLTLNGTTIATSSSTTSAAALATQINLQTATTGVTATAQAASSGVLAFTDVSTGSSDSYNLTVGGVTVASLGANSSLTAAQLDSALQSTDSGSVGAQLTAAGITVTGTAADGTLAFSSASGANLAINQNASSGTSGGFTGINSSGTTQTYMGGVDLTSANAITVAGTSPTTAGLTAGSTLTSGTYANSTFTQDASNAGGSVTIGSSNDSLAGIASAINSAGIGVTATIVNDGSSSPYHLVLTSSATGAASSMKISVSGDSTLSSLLSYDPSGTQNLTQSASAQNAALTVNGLAITSASNNVAGAVQGLSLSLTATGSSTVAVTQNSSSVETSVQSLVSAYNSLNSTFTSAIGHNTTTNTYGPLLGDSGVQTVQEQLRAVLGGTIAGTSDSMNSLAQLGITFQSDGSMALDSTTLNKAVTNNFGNVAALFTAVGNASDSLVSFKSSTSDSKAGTYAINVSQVATQGTEVGSAAPGLTITTGSNDALSVLIDGVSASVTLAAGTYTASSLATAVQSAINGASAISNAGSSVKVAVDSSGALSITSQRYGSASLVTLSGNAANTLLGSAPTSTTGLDVEGTIGGNPASGSGQVLTGSAGSATAGLALTVDGGLTGSRGTLTFSQGYAYQLNTALTSIMGTTGPITTETTGLNNDITGIQSQIKTLNKTLAAQQANYMAEFQALDTTMSKLDATQTYLTQELASLASSSSG